MPAFELAPDDHIAFSVNTMDLKNRLRDVETNRRNSLHGPVLRVGSPHGDHGTYVPVEEPSTASPTDNPILAHVHRGVRGPLLEADREGVGGQDVARWKIFDS